MKIREAFIIFSILTFSSSLFALSPANQNTTKGIESNALYEPTLNARFTLAPMMINSFSKEYGFATDFIVQDDLVMGPQISYQRYSGQWSDATSYGIGFSVTYSLTKNFKDGWFISPGAKIYSYNVEERISQGESTDVPKNLTNLSLMYGYKWVFKDGFNIRLAAGLQHNSGDTFAEQRLEDVATGAYRSHLSSIRGGSGLTLDSDLSLGLIF